MTIAVVPPPICAGSRRSRRLLVAVLALTALLASGDVSSRALAAADPTAMGVPKTCASGPKSTKRGGVVRTVRIGTGNIGGVFFPYGGGVGQAIRAAMPSVDVEVLSTGGSVDNLQLLASNDLELALTTVDAATDAVLGNPPYLKPIRVCALAVLYTSYVHVAVRADSAMTAIGDLAGKRVSVGSALSSTEVASDRLLREAGIDPNSGIQRLNQTLAESVAALINGNIDALFWVGGVPTAAIVDLTTARAVRFLATDRYVTALRQHHGKVYQAFTLAAGVYPGVERPIGGLGIGNLLVARADMNPDFVYDALDALFEDLPRVREAHPEAKKLSIAGASQPTAIPFHAGALRFYRERCNGRGLQTVCKSP